MSHYDKLFWINRGEEHAHFLKQYILTYFEKLSSETHSNISGLLRWADDVEDAWNFVPQEDDESLIDLIHETKKFYGRLFDVFKVAKIPCVPSLAEHMSEELDYFEDAIIRDEWSLAQEAAWWAQEHKENLTFVTCELPQISHWHQLRLSEIPLILKIAAESRKLANTFGRISSSIQKEGLTPELYYELMYAKQKHIRSIKTLIDNLGALPLKQNDRLLVGDMLVHELKEAEFAQRRLHLLWTNPV